MAGHPTGYTTAAAGTLGARLAGSALFLLLCGLLFLSGAAGLMYQVVWVRLLGLAFGVTVYAISTVLAAFMAGLALGSIVGGLLSDRLRRPLLAYGLAELGVAATAVATPTAFRLLQQLYGDLSMRLDVSEGAVLAGTVRAALAFGLLLVPTGLMGATLPLAVRGARRAADVGADSRAMGFLYALNTTGAITGTLAAGFVLIGSLGITGTVLAAALCNVVAGVGGILLSLLFREGSMDGVPTSDRRGAAAAPTAVHAEKAASRMARVALLVFGLSGGVSLAYEVVWSRLLAVLFDSSIYSFSLMLATVLLGIAIGSALAGPIAGRISNVRHAGAAFGWVEVGIGLGAIYSLASFGATYGFLLAQREGGDPRLVRFIRDELHLAAVAGVITVLPAGICMGASFPLAARLWAAGAPRLGRRLGGLYAANVSGAILGSLLAGLVLLPWLGAHTSLALLAGINVALGAVVLLLAGQWFSLHALVAAALGAALIGWGVIQPQVHTLVFGQRFGDQLLWYREGLENTVTVARDAAGVQTLYTNSHGQTNDAPGVAGRHRQVGHLAALLSPRPGRVLAIGLGAGATPAAIASHAGMEVDFVELSEAVVAAAPWFRQANDDILNLPNVHISINDGRNHLLRVREPYQVIVADVVHPYEAGSNNLYSVEYFQLAARALRPDGLMVQWVPSGSKFEHQTIVRTFLQAFPQATLWLSGDLLVGSREPLKVAVRRLEAELADPRLRESLAAVDIRTKERVFDLFRAHTEELRAYAGEGPVLTDDRPLLEYFRSIDVAYQPVDVSHFNGDVRKVL